MKTLTLTYLFLPLFLLSACGDDTTNQGGGGGDVGGQGQGGQPQGGENQGGVPQGGQGGQGQGGAGAVCGGIAGVECDANHYCDFPSDSCGSGDEQGTCQPLPNGCTAEDIPTCGCDGEIHSSACDANSAGVDVSVTGCDAPAGSFQCGAGFCDLATQACFETGNDTSEPPPVFYSCGDLPDACSQVDVPTCDCAGEAATACGGTCEEGPDGGVVITCPGG